MVLQHVTLIYCVGPGIISVSSPQSSLAAFAETLQEMNNYHTVSVFVQQLLITCVRNCVKWSWWTGTHCSLFSS